MWAYGLDHQQPPAGVLSASVGRRQTEAQMRARKQPKSWVRALEKSGWRLEGSAHPQRGRARSPQPGLEGALGALDIQQPQLPPRTRSRSGQTAGSRADSREGGEELGKAGPAFAGEETKSGRSGGEAPHFWKFHKKITGSRAPEPSFTLSSHVLKHQVGSKSSPTWSSSKEKAKGDWTTPTQQQKRDRETSHKDEKNRSLTFQDETKDTTGVTWRVKGLHEYWWESSEAGNNSANN